MCVWPLEKHIFEEVETEVTGVAQGCAAGGTDVGEPKTTLCS